MLTLDKNMRLKVLYLGIACVTLVTGTIGAACRFSQDITFENVSVSDGVDFWLQKWQSSDGLTITESMYGYPSTEDARIAFEKELKDAETIIERKKNPAGFSNVDERVVGNFINPKSKEKIVSIIRLQKKNVYRADAPTVNHALSFEEYRKRDNE